MKLKDYSQPVLNPLRKSTATGALTNAAAAISPTLVLPEAGRYNIRATVQFDLAAGTYAASRAITTTLERTNNTPAVLATRVINTMIVTTLTYTNGFITFDIDYDTVNADDIIVIKSLVGTVPSAGAQNYTVSELVANKRD